MTRAIEDRLWVRVQRGPPCWLWTGARNSAGYGHLSNGRAGGGNTLAHRLAWAIAYGPIPPGMDVCHHCDTPLCVKTEPDETFPAGHLFVGTRLDNMRDSLEKGRLAHGERLPQSKLRAHQIPGIRAGIAAGRRYADIAREFGVTDANIVFIARGETWRRVP